MERVLFAFKTIRMRTVAPTSPDKAGFREAEVLKNYSVKFIGLVIRTNANWPIFARICLDGISTNKFQKKH